MNETHKRCKVFNLIKLFRPFVLILFSPMLFSEVAWSTESSQDPVRVAEDRVEALSADRGPFHPDLVQPLIELADIYLTLGDSDLALDSLQRAQNILHREEGVYTKAQIALVRKMADIAIAMEDFSEANTQQEFVHRIRTYDDETDDEMDVPARVAASLDLADWYTFSGQPMRARKLLQDAIESVDSPEARLNLQVRINESRRLQDTCCRTGDLEEDVADPAGVSNDSLSAAYLELADSAVLRRRDEDAANYYQLAHGVMPGGLTSEPEPITARRRLRIDKNQPDRMYRISNKDRFFERRLRPMTHQEMMEDESRTPQWFILDPDQQHLAFTVPDANETFDDEKRTQKLAGRPIRFDEKQLNNLLRYRFARRSEPLRLEYTFTVTESGDLEDITLVESNGPSRLNRLVKDALRRSYYRPALVDGRPERRENVRLIQVFDPTVDREDSE